MLKSIKRFRACRVRLEAVTEEMRPYVRNIDTLLLVACCCDAIKFQTIDTLVLPEKIMVAHAMPSLFVRT